MRRLLSLLLLALPLTARGQIFRSRDDPNACDGEPRRSTIIGASIGGSGMLALALISDSDHHIAPNERLPYLWGVTAGASLSGAVERMMAAHHCPPPVLPFDALRPCAGAAFRGAGVGAALGGIEGFDIGPILLLPLALAAAVGNRQLHFGRDIAVVAGAGAVVGAPIGAALAHRSCRGF